MRARVLCATLAFLLSSSPPAAAQWLPGGVRLCADMCGGNQPILCSDGAGGAFVTWVNGDVYVQHVASTGSLSPGWPAAGIPLCTATDYQAPEGIVSDGQGGAIVEWIDYRTAVSTGIDIYAQRVTGAGEIPPGWPVNGAPVTRALGDQDLPVVAPDGGGGAIFSWDDYHPVRDLYAQHLTSSGSVADGWPADGLPVSTADGGQAGPAIVPDGAGGAMIVWNDSRAAGWGVYGRRISASGSIAPGWVANGLPVVLGKGHVHMVADDTILLTWYDYRDYSTAASDIYALRVLPDGSLAPGLSANGVRVTNRAEAEYDPDIAPDGAGGAYLCWRREGGDGFRILVQHVTADGAVAPGWLPNGIGVGTSSEQFDPRITTDEHGGSIVAWEERLLGGTYAQRFVMDGIVPVLLSLVRAQAEADHVVLSWYSAQAAGLEAAVWRRTEGSDWMRLGAVTADGTGFLRFEDHAVSAGERYAYRLGYVESGRESFTAESWVEVPALQLALEGLRPNPAVGALQVWFTLPDAKPATLELLDVSGRRVLAHEVGALGAGHHVLRLDQAAGVSPGLYWVSLRHEGQTLRARAAVIR